MHSLASYGILTGYADGTFRPDAPISRPRSPFCCTAVSLRHLWGSMGKNLCLRMFLPGTGRNAHIQHEDSGLVTGRY
ncbi:MAG: S-layer homology domain-containing protein [Dysosmobacter sp.]